MNIRQLASVALLSVGLSGCALAPYTTSGTNWSSPNHGGVYAYRPAPTYWVAPVYSVRQVPPSRPYYREEVAHHPHRDHDRDERSDHHFAGRGETRPGGGRG